MFCLIGKFVDERLSKETMLGMIDTAPCAKWNMCWAISEVNILIANVIQDMGRFCRFVLVDKLIFPRGRLP